MLAALLRPLVKFQRQSELSSPTAAMANANYDSKDFQKFLDNQQYTRNGILRYEKIFGEDYVSTGGITTTTEFVKMLDLKPGQKVLDVGCGIGGSAFLMNKEYGQGLYSKFLNLAKIVLNFAFNPTTEHRSMALTCQRI